MTTEFRIPPLRRDGSTKQVQLTNDDAQVSKLSCVRAGYFIDNFVQYFVRKPLRRSPLINRGYYSRYAAIHTLLRRFLALPTAARKQVLVLGAGFDTSWFQLASEDATGGARWFEVDFKEVTSKKAEVVAATPALCGVLHAASEAHVDAPAGRISADCYRMFPADLRQPDALWRLLDEADFDPSAPTVVLSECVIVYLTPEHGAAVLRALGTRLTCAALVLYQQVRPDDAFGRQMVSNLEQRGCPLLGLPATPTLDAAARLLTSNCWSVARAWDMHELYMHHLDPKDKARIERLEIFDEFEEWHMIQEHYCVTVAHNDCAGVLAPVGFTQPQAESRASENDGPGADGPDPGPGAGVATGVSTAPSAEHSAGLRPDAIAQQHDPGPTQV